MDKVKLNELVFGGFKYPERKIKPSSSSSTDYIKYYSYEI